MTPVLALLAAIALSRWWRGRRAVARRTAEARAALPELIELLVVLIRAGLSPALAVAELAGRGPPPFTAALTTTSARLTRGERFAEAIGAFTELHGELLDPLVSTLAHADRHGGPLGPILDRLATDARHDRRRQAEIRVRQLPVQLSIPLVCCTLPAFVVLTIVPMLAGTFSSFSGLDP